MTKQKKLRIPKKLAILILLAILVAGVLIVKSRSDNKAPLPTAPTSQQDSLNLDPPTAEDSQRAEANKQAIVDRDKQQSVTQPSGTLKAVTPIITYAGQYGNAIEVGGYVSGIFEDGGTCTANFKSASLSLSKAVQAVKNANSVNCPVMSLPTSDFKQKGTWSVTVTYLSSSASGVSEQRQIEVK